MADKLLTAPELADLLGVPVGTLYQWRVKRVGPPPRASESSSATAPQTSSAGSNRASTPRARPPNYFPLKMSLGPDLRPRSCV